jgi:NADH dehydrogenase
VDEYNRIIGCDDIFALGDVAYMDTPLYPAGYPQLAQVAIQQARNLSKNLNLGEMKTPFKYKDKGTMATIGRNRAVADLNHIYLYGRPAWLTWMFIHLISILGMRNKVSVLINWVWAYFSYSTSLRLLIRPTKFPHRKHWDSCPQ